MPLPGREAMGPVDDADAAQVGSKMSIICCFDAQALAMPQPGWDVPRVGPDARSGRAKVAEALHWHDSI